MIFHNLITLIVVTLFATTIHQCESARILGLFSFPGKSHGIMTNSIMRRLAEKGHQVDILTNFPAGKPIANYTEIVISPTYDFWTDAKEALNMPGIFEMNDMSIGETLTLFYTIGLSTTNYALQHPNVKKLMQSKEKYDLIIVEQFYQEAFLMFAHQFKAPVISIGTFGFGLYMNEMMGSFNSWSHVAHESLPFSDKMTLFERIQNTATTLYEIYQRNYYYLPKQQEMVDKYFTHIPHPRPSVKELTRSMSAILVNSHIPLASVRPKVPGLIEIGGAHIGKPKALPQDIKKFLDDAKDGAIFFSLGSNLRSSDMPEKQLSAFINTFKHFSNIRVLWKYEDENVDRLPKTVMVKNWMPQNDILAHPNVKVFITHGGLLGTQEGAYHGVPMLGMPIYCDQHLNMHKANSGGYAISLAFQNVTEDALKWSLNELLNNPIYMKTAKKTSQIFNDRPLSAMDESIYWIEYIIRYKGAPQLRSSALDTTYVSYFLVDIIFIAIGSVLFLFILLSLCVRKICCGSGNKKSSNSSGQNKKSNKKQN